MSHPYRALMAILGVYFVLALGYNAASPLFENSDEFFHFPLVKHLADSNWSLPVQEVETVGEWRQQGNQPPAYHMLSAALIKPLDTSDYAEVRRLNPHAQLGVVGESNINAVIHPLDRSEEFQGGTAWALRLVRLFSTLLNAIVIVSAYFLTVYTFPTVPRWVGLLAASLVAFNPMVLFVASSVNNDNLSNAMICGVLALLVWLYRRDDKPPARVLLLIGAMLGLSLLSKLSTGPFMLLVGLFWLFIALQKKAFWYMVRWGFATLGLALLISGWWYIRNWDLYGDPTGLDRFLDIVGRRAIPLTPEQLWSERDSFIQAFWGLFGALTVPMAEWTYDAFNALAALSLFGAGLYLWRNRAADADHGWLSRIDLPQIVLILWPLMALVSVIRWTALTWASQGRLWYIAITALATLSAIGFYEIGRRVKMPALAWLPAGYALVIAIAAPIIWIAPAYAAPELAPQGDETSLSTFADPLDATQRIALMRADFPIEIQTGEAAEINLRFCAETDLSRDWSVYVHLVNEWEIIIAQADFTPGFGALLTSEISAGQCWDDTYPINVAAGVAANDTPLDVRVGLYDASEFTRMADANGRDFALAAQTTLRVGDALLDFTLAERVRVAGYDLSATVAEAGDTLALTLDWEVLRPLPRDYTVFVQVINPATAYRAAASDQAPQPPTSAWESGQSVPDTHQLTIAEDAPAGVYALIVGMYHQPEQGNFQRLRMVYDGVDTGFDVITLGQIRID